MKPAPITLTFVVAFPIVSMLIIGGVFGTGADAVFPVNPSHWYVASYFTTVIGAVGLVMLPVHIATYREREECAAQVRRRRVPAVVVRGRRTGHRAHRCCGGERLLMAVAAPVYGIPAVADVPG